MKSEVRSMKAEGKRYEVRGMNREEERAWGGGGLLIDPYGMTGVLLFWIAYGVVARFE
jgi:hypothetical protein